MLLSSVSSQQRFGVTDIKALSVSHLLGLGQTMLQLSGFKYTVRALRQISVTALCYSSILFRKQQENPSSRHEGMPTQRHEEKRAGERASTRERKRETPGPLAPLFKCFFLPLGLPYVNWASQECCLFYLRPSLRSGDLPWFHFRGLFPSLSFSHRHSGLLLPVLTT